MIPCWLAQKLISLRLDSGQGLRGWPGRHARKCPACRDFQATHRQLGRRLALEAKTRADPAPRFLQQRIMAVVQQQAEGAATAHVDFRWAWAGVTALASVALLCGVFALKHSTSPPDGAGIDPQGQVPPLALLSSVPIPEGTRLIEWGRQLDQPLESEMELVVLDARRVVRGLAQEFLPD